MRNLCIAVAMASMAACTGSRSAAQASDPEPPARTKTATSGEGLDATLSGFAYPFEVHERVFQSQRQTLRMAYMDVRPANPNGRAVLLLHGKNFSGAYWERTIRALTERGYRVVVPDQIGFGKSSKPRAFQFTFEALAAHTRDLLDAIGVEKVAVVGHSMGGMLATRFSLMFPDRSERLVLVNPIGLEDWSHVVPYQPVDAWFQRELASTPEAIREYMRQSYFDGGWKPEYDPLVTIQAGWTQGPDREQIAWVSALTYDMIFTQPVVHEFPRLQTPTLLIIGVRDRTALGKNLVTPEVAKQLGDYDRLGEEAARVIPNATLVELEGVGHVPQYEAFDAYLKALLSFLDADAR